MNKYYNKPLSPHLTIYKPQLTSIMSISHRLTGVVLFFSVIIASWLIASLIYCQANDNLVAIKEILANNNWLVVTTKLLGIIIAFSLYYHLLNGIRHLFWDIGKGFELKNVYRSGYIVLIGTIILTIFTLYYINNC